MEKVKNNGTALKDLSAEERNTKEIVLAAVKHYGKALQYASDALKADKEVVLAAVRQNGNALMCCTCFTRR